MKFLKNCDIDNALLRTLEKSEKNRWRWEWLTDTDSSEKEVPHSTWCRKVDLAGGCFCIACGRTISYGSSGRKSLLRHSRDASHVQAVKDTSTNYKLSGASSTTSTEPCLADRTCESKAILCSSIAEHCLPFSLAPELVQLAKHLSNNQKAREALDKLTISRTSAAYSLTHGVARSIKEELKKKLKGQPFSIAVDEATNAANDKVVNVLIQYFCDEQNKVVMEHLGSKVVNIATAANISERNKVEKGQVESQILEVFSRSK